MNAARPITIRYAEPDYWEARYQREPAVFEWFFGHTALRRIIRTYLSKKKPILHIGCGTSNLQEGMAKSGYTIVNTDISAVVIKQMQQRHSQYTNMTYQVSDCRNMPEFLDCSFGHVLDKGTIDALLCCKQGTDNVMRMLLEVYRVLQPGGTFLLVSLGDPSRRLPMLCDPRLPWKVTVLLLPKISAANQAYIDGKPINDSTEPVEALGPFEVVDADTILDMPEGVQYSNFFFVYVCKKQPLQLPQHQGQKGQLPNGWVAGSKELFQKLQKEMGLPEDLLDKGRRKRVMQVPSRQSSMQSALQLQGRASSTGFNGLSGATSPTTSHTTASTAPNSRCSSTVPPRSLTPVQDLQSALTALQLQQQARQLQELQEPSGAAAVPLGSGATDSMQQQGPAGLQQHPDVPARPQSAPDLASLAAAAAAASATAAAAVPSPRAQAAMQQAGMADETTAAAAAAVPAVVMPAAASSSSSTSPVAPAAVVSAPLPTVRAAAAAEAAVAGVLPPHHSDAAAVCLSPDSRPPLLLHAISSPPRLQPGTAAVAQGAPLQQQQPAVAQQPAAATQVSHAYVQPASSGSNSSGAAAARPLSFAAAHGSEPALAAVADEEVEPPPLPPSGKANGPRLMQSIQGTPQTHIDLGGISEPVAAAAAAAWSPCTQQQQQQQQQDALLSELQSLHTTAMSAATAAGMYPHPVAPRNAARAPRLRRFSTETSALYGSAALQQQLEQLRMAQAQHSESAADGLVLHDVAAGDPCGSGAAAAAAVAAAAWGSVRRPRDRRLSNISALSGISMLSSTSIDESGEEQACVEEEVSGQGSAATATCSEPTGQLLCSPLGRQAAAGPAGQLGCSPEAEA